MNPGGLQVGVTKEIYIPSSIFVLEFHWPTPPMNFINGKVNEKGVFEAGKYRIQLPNDKEKCYTK